MDTAALYRELDALYGSGNPEKIEHFLLAKANEAESINDAAEAQDLLIWSKNELGSLYRGLGLFDDSEEAFLAAIASLSQLDGEHREELAISYNNLGGTYRMAQRNNDALASFQKAMALYQELDAFDAYGYASVFNNLALVYEQLGQSEQAIEYLLTALEQLQDRGLLLPVAISQTNLAILLNKIGQRERADELLALAAEIFETHFPGDYHQAALFAAKGSLQAADNDADALMSFQAAADIIKANYGESHEYQMMQKNIAILLERFGPGACKARPNGAEGESGAVCE